VCVKDTAAKNIGRPSP